MTRGDNWRILAHAKDGQSIDIRSLANWRALKRNLKEMGQPPPVGSDGLVVNDSVFDEVVINPWFHLEEMDAGVWWLTIGGYHLWVRVDAKGNAVVTANGLPLSEYGLGRDE